MYSNFCHKLIEVLLCLSLGLIAGTAAADTDIYLRAEATTLTLPDGRGATVSVPAWGFAQDTAFGALDGALSVPGPMLKLPPGETLLRIHLDNNLAEPISIHINGLIQANYAGPVFSALGNDSGPGSIGARPDPTVRVRSFSQETPPGNAMAVVYEFLMRPGTFMYASGTNPAKQVQMGLYGALKLDVAPGEAYPGVFYTREIVLLYSEVDPVLQTAIAGGTYGAGRAIGSSIHRDPKYYLINGKAYDPTAPAAGGLDPLLFLNRFDRVLLRFVNAGYETHVPQLLNTYVRIVAEDGNALRHANAQYGVNLPAGKTADALLAPAAEGRFSIHDGALHLTNNGAPAPGGMLAYYTVGCAGDIDGNGLVNLADLALLRANMGNTCTFGAPCPGDINMDGRVGLDDLALLRANFGRTGCPQP